jgi:uncharacterized membrane protein YecN with MAPEG domain
MTALPNLPIVALYVGLNGLILLWLAGAVSMVRMRSGIWTGDGGSTDLARVMRGQANFAEYVPLCLLLLLLMAALGAPGYILHLFGLALTGGRVAHALHFTDLVRSRVTREAGALLTFAVLLLGSLGVIVHGMILLV